MLVRENCLGGGVPAITPRSSDRCEICCSFKPPFLFFSFSLLCLFVNLCFSFSCKPRTLANIGLETLVGERLYSRRKRLLCVSTFSDSCSGLSFFVFFVVLSCSAIPRRFFPATGLRLP